VDTVFNLLVGGEFDLEINFIIHDEQCILYMLDVMEICSVQCQAEIWSTFKGICRKSYRNLQACVEVGLLQKLLYVLHDANEVISELLVDMLCLLASYNISVKELKKLLSLLRAEGDKWPVHAVKLLGVLQATTERHGPDCFFSFPGRHNAAIALPPLKAWPYSNGFTFTTWFRMDPLNSLRLDVDKPYLYCFRNSKGLGYSGHFVGNCFIVTVLKSRGKGFQHCLKFEFKPRKWYMVTVVHIYNRWRSSEIKCYANGQLVSHSEMNWSIGGSDQYDKCFLGSAETGDDARVFCGQIAATYVFNEALSPSQAYALYQLGPSYKFKFSTESDHLLANHHRKVLYEDSKLSDSLVLAYNPKSTDGQLCLECSPKSNRDNSSEAQRWFVHNPHALMLPGVKAVVTHSIHSALHSVGGAEVLFPLFSQLNYKQKDGSVDTSQVYLSKIRLSGSVKTQQQVLHGKGFLVIGTLLERAHKDHITMGVLDTIMAMAKFLDQLSTGSALMRQFCDYILFNPALWIHTTPEVQIALYTFLATEFVSSPTIQTNLRRVSTVLLLIHALKHYYWVENPQPRSGVLPKGLAKDEILSIRAFILLFLKQLVTRTGGILEDELHKFEPPLLQDENILDVLQLLVAMVSEHGGTVAPVFDQRNGVVAIFKLLGSRSESVRVHALKLLAYFLKNLNTKRKTELLETQSLFMLVGERLLLYSDEFSLTTYNAMYEVLVEEPSTQLLQKCHSEPSATTLISNPVMLKVIGTILRQCSSPHTMELKLTYLNDLLLLFQMSRDNRRILLQQSVWQDWMLELGYLKPCSVQERDCQELIYSIFKVLLYHAIKLEWGGWRVWVDTLAIVHSKVSKDKQEEFAEEPAPSTSTQSGTQQVEFSPGPRTVVFRVPEFNWSEVHLRLLDDLFSCLEVDIENWKSTNKMVELVNHSDNLILVHNTIHLVSQMIDNVILACGGILPILSSATSPNYELDSVESGHGLSMESAWSILNRLAAFTDVLAFATNINFSEIENEKNMSNGGILRQCLRTGKTLFLLYLRTSASVPSTPSTSNDAKDVAVSATEAAGILLSMMSNDATPVVDPHKLLQENDVNRLKASIYRDLVNLDDTKQSQFLALAVVYFVSVLMVSKYRDILDPESHEKLRQATVANRNSPKKKKLVSSAEVEAEEEDIPMDTVVLSNGHRSPENERNEEKEDPENKDGNLGKKIMKLGYIKCSTKNFNIKEFFELPLSNYMEISESSVSKQFSKVSHSPGDVSSRLERSMDQLAPLLRDIFIDFSSYLSKILTGSHGQELLVEGMVCMKSYTSVVELVMLLCSQEWQNSIQKNAGLAFIELINEGRLLCHAMKDHVVRVANEADFILSKQRAEDVKRHAQFESSSALFLAQQREEERQCDSLITAAKHRDHAQAHALKNRITNILTNKLGAWGSAFNSEFWKLDSWEDDTRRRRRFVRNPYGSSHPKATLMSRAELSKLCVFIKPAIKCCSLPRSPSNYSTHGAEQLAANEDDVIAADDVDQEELQGPVSFSTEADLIAPGVCLHGTFSITPDEFYFEVLEHHESFAKADPKVLLYIDGIHGKWLFQEVRAVFSRRYLLNNTALEIFLANRTCIMFNYPDADVMKKVVNYLPRVGIGTGCGLPQARRISLASPRQLLKSSNMTERWQRREVSNFEYIMFLNTISGRTFNDLNQYPVFPWVISNYDCEDLDLSLPSNFRDLSKPIGALNPKRSNYFASRYESWDDPTIPKFHYGTHYSNAAFTLGWLVRVEPFTSMFLNLQGGKFDHADRTFHSVQQSWKNCQRDSHDVKELIPEFYYLPEMFVNSNKYNLGKTSDGETLNDVKLPKWAKSADDFVRINRMALESEIVSCQIHQWIDLIFGFKQRGPEAVRATNVFYYLTYEGSVDLNKITDPVERSGLRDQIKNFGQTPSQLQMVPHPPRSSAMHITPMMFKEPEAQDVIMVLKFQSNSPVVYVTANTHPSLQQPAVFTCTKNLHFCVNKWNQIPDAKTTAPSAGDLDKPKLLPIEPDPLTNHGVNSAKRQIAETLDQSVEVHRGCFSVTADNKYLLSCGYWDRSFRIVYVESGALHQVVFGHWDVVTCISRSETYIGGDCYFVTGSRDATLMLWYWSGRRHLIVGDSNTLTENPTARAILTGHDTEITCAAVCAELGLIASGSLEGPILLHTITGDLLRSLEPDLPPDSGMPSSPQPELIVFTNEGMVIASYKQGLLCNFTMNGRNLSSKIIDDNIKGMLGSNNSQFLVTGGDKGVVQVWSAWDFNHLYTFPQCDAGIRAIALSHDQKTVITGMTSGSIVAFHINFNRWHYEYQN
uniref:BEACH domain-containing protein n=1 Tax=Ciona savignyi TaxID=51511 RepID=H2YT40_CIOSA